MTEQVETESRLGTDFVGYRIDAVIGRGGMGVVYRAYDRRLKRNVALKLIAPEYAKDDRFRERFLIETELAASLEHPSVVPIYDAGEVDGQLYLAMRFVEGSDLKRLLVAEGVLAPERAVDVLGHVADALDAAHELDLVHRDVKPSNVLLDERDHPYLADFGLTRRLDDPTGPTAGVSVGTPAYVAPEQIRGEQVDGRADQYALACVLHECLTGEPPFRRASEVALLYAHLEDEPVPIGGPIDAVLTKALAKSPVERYATCAEFVAAAREALGVARPLRERRRALASLAAAAVSVAVLGAAVFAVLLTSSEGASGRETSGRLVRIDPNANRATDTIAVGNEPNAVAVSRSGVWIANRKDATLWRVDPSTGDVELKVSAQGTPAEIAVDEARVFVAAGPVEAKVAVIDPATGQQQDLFPIARGSFFGSPSVAATGSEVWVATGDRRVGRLNLLTGALVDPLVIPQPPAERADAMLSGIAVGEVGSPGTELEFAL